MPKTVQKLIKNISKIGQHTGQKQVKDRSKIFQKYDKNTAKSGQCWHDFGMILK